MIAAGDLRARQVSGRWLIEGKSLPTSPRRGRPMSQLVAWQFVSPEPPDDVSAQDRYRRRQRRARLASDAEPELVEGYTVVGDLSSMQQPHLLTPAGGDANVILHVTHTLPDCPVPPLLLAADLAEHGGPRELIRARELIREALT